MADKKISELDAITGANTAADDYFIVVDTSGSATKKISRAELNNAIEKDVLSSLQPGIAIEGSSSSDALRITQTGSGNALVVEDSANPDSTPAVIDSSGIVIVGHTDKIQHSTTFPQVQTHTTGSPTNSITSWASSSADPARFILAKSRSGTIGTRGVVTSGTYLGLIRFMGDDGTSFLDAAAIGAYADGTPGTNDMPGRLVFSTTSDGASSPTERMRIDSSGRVGIGTSSPGRQLTVNGSIQFASGGVIEAGTSTLNTYIAGVEGASGRWAFATNGTERMRIDSSGNVGIGTSSPGEKLNVSTGGSEYAIQWNSTGSNNWVLASASNRAYIVNKSTPLEVLTILNGGNVGIGTTAPLARLAMSGGGILATQDGDYFSGGAYYNAGWKNSVSSQGGWAIRNTSGVFTVYTGASPGTAGSAFSDFSEKFRIDNSGNVGIGVTSPTFKIDVRATTAPVANFYQLTAATHTDIYVNNVGSANNFLISRRSNGQSWLYNSGADPFVFSTNATQRLIIESGGVVRPGADNTQTLGSASFRWSVVYAGTGTINTSDEREKQQIANLDDAERRVAVAIKGLVKKYKYNDAVALKGNDARIHVGVIAQEVIAAFAAEGLDATRYALLCHDTWEAEPEETDEEGNVIKPAHDAGERYGIRYDELLAFMIAAL